MQASLLMGVHPAVGRGVPAINRSIQSQMMLVVVSDVNP